MCWVSDNITLKKIAKRDFYVYKIGKVIENNIFVSNIRGYSYIPKYPNKIVPLVPHSLCVGNYITNRYIINRGYHSYKWIALDDSYLNERCLGNYDPDLKENKHCCIATFVVPKGAEYFENKYGHIVSSEIIYTGKYLRL